MSAPETVASAVSEVVSDWESANCVACGQSFARRRSPEPRETCPPCASMQEAQDRIAREVVRIRQNVGPWVEKACAKWGMTPRERTASLEQLAPNIRRIFGDPRLHVRSMLDGVIPDKGFGLMGPTGTGKTLAFAAVVKRMIGNRWLMQADTLGMGATSQFVAWVRWPEEVNRFRTIVGSVEGGLKEAQDVIDRWATFPVLVLDDLGAERLRGDYSEDWATSLLDILVDRRHNEMLPVWWTSNLSRDEFIERYGTRLWSRLAGDNPGIVVPNGPDLRIVQGEA